MKRTIVIGLWLLLLGFAGNGWAQTHSDAFGEKIFDPGELKPVDSQPTVQVGDKAPDFRLPAISGQTVTLSQYWGKKNVVLSFVPAAWTPVCSDQWPGYNIVEPMFRENDATLLGITVDNLPTLHAWTNQMGGLWFPVLSDFWPHGAVAKKFGILRSDGTAERALIIVDKKGIIRFVEVYNINKRPPLETLMKAIEGLQ